MSVCGADVENGRNTPVPAITLATFDDYKIIGKKKSNKRLWAWH